MVTIVVDTNLLIAGMWNKDSASLRIIEDVIAGRAKAVYSPRIKDENLFILQKVKAPREYLDRIFKFYDLSQIVRPTTAVNASRDRSDNRFLEAAIAGKADYVVTNDMHLLELEEFEGVRMIRPREYEKMSRK